MSHLKKRTKWFAKGKKHCRKRPYKDVTLEKNTRTSASTEGASQNFLRYLLGWGRAKNVGGGFFHSISKVNRKHCLSVGLNFTQISEK